MQRFYLGAAAFVGGLVAMLADLIQKDLASATLKMANTFNENLGIPYSTFVAICLVLLIAVALCFIFEIHTTKHAFYTGASVLAILMTVVPYNVPRDFKTKPNSVEVVLKMKTQDGKQITDAVVTLTNSETGNIIAQRKMSDDEFRFYQKAGRYGFSVEMPGYESKFVDIELVDGSAPQQVSVTLLPSGTPLFFQRLQLRQPQKLPRFTKQECGAINDRQTGLDWFVGPDHNMTWYEAKRWVEELSKCGGDWRMPKMTELQTLFDRKKSAGRGYFEREKYWPAHIDPVFEAIGDGSWAWACDEPEREKAMSFNFNQGCPVRYSAMDTHYTTRAFAVRKQR
jgi:hypothetical protein